MKLELNEKKSQRQEQGIQLWRSAGDRGISPANGVGTFWWATGVGKTYTGCNIGRRIVEKNNASTIVIIVPSDELEKQWNQAVKNFVPEPYQKNFSVKTVHKAVDSPYRIICTLLILDEVHEYLTDDRLKIINGELIEAKYKLGLTATWEDRHGRHKKIESIIPVVDRITDQEAQESGFISKYIEFNLGISLNADEAKAYVEASDTISRNLAKFNKNLEFAGKCLAGDKKNKAISYCIALAKSKGWAEDLDRTDSAKDELYKTWHPRVIMGSAMKLMEAVKKRKDILYNAQEKLKIAGDIVFKFSSLKTICFSQSTTFADRLAWLINSKEEPPNRKPICVVYHSKIPTRIVYDETKGKEIKKGATRLKKEAIEAIKNGSARIISTASALDRGFDVPGIALSITTSGTQNPTQHIQRGGRAKRAKEDEDAVSLIINIYVRGTQDEVWLKKRQSKSTNIVYWVDNVNDINYTPQRKDVFNINSI